MQMEGLSASSPSEEPLLEQISKIKTGKPRANVATVTAVDAKKEQTPETEKPAESMYRVFDSGECGTQHEPYPHHLSGSCVSADCAARTRLSFAAPSHPYPGHAH